MALTWWWLSLLALVALVVVGVVAWVTAGRSKDGKVVLAAHTDRLTRLPAYRTALTRQRRRVTVLGALLGLTLLAGTVAVGRPASVRTITPENRNRDIMLCLDVSGSMERVDQQLMTTYAQLVKGFHGERVGMVVFNGQSLTAFPLTDDYDLIAEQLDGYSRGLSFDPAGLDPFTGTFSDEGSSLVPDGLASCVLGFDHAEQRRSRVLILGTDNDVHGRTIYSLDQATSLARERSVRIYAFNPVPQGANAEALARAADSTGGRQYALSDDSAVEEISHEIQASEAQRLDSAPRRVRTDHPAIPIAAVTLLLGAYLVLVWRWRR